MDFDWDRDALDAEIGAAAAERGLAPGAGPREDVRHLLRGQRPGVVEQLWNRTTELPPDAPYALTRRRWAFAALEHDRLAESRVALEQAWHEERHPVPQPEPGLYTVAELRAKALSDAPRRALWLQAFSAASSNVGEQFARFWHERFELCEQVKTEHMELDGETPIVLGLAERWLGRTDGMNRALALDESHWLETALGCEAREGWPGHLNWRTIADLLGVAPWIGDARLRLPDPPRALGASSYCRAFRAWGAAWADAQLARGKPFMAWRDPTRLAERTRGSLLALLPLNGEFMRRRQGLSRQRVRDQRRHLARALLLESRWAALRTTLRKYFRSGALRGPGAFLPELEELSARVLGFAPPSVVPGVMPRLRALDAQDFVALLLASHRGLELVDRYDEDWFWNPRCCEVLRDALPTENAAVSAPDVESGSDALYNAIVEAFD